VSPSKSLIVVMNGPDANAGLNPNLFINIGVTVPTKDENITTQKSANETMTES